jgi:hypothetical protein
MLVTIQDVPMNFRGYDIIVPMATRLTHRTALGHDPNYHFVDDLSFIDKKQWPLLWHDAYYYGIDIPKEFVTEI